MGLRSCRPESQRRRDHRTKKPRSPLHGKSPFVVISKRTRTGVAARGFKRSNLTSWTAASSIESSPPPLTEYTHRAQLQTRTCTELKTSFPGRHLHRRRLRFHAGHEADRTSASSRSAQQRNLLRFPLRHPPDSHVSVRLSSFRHTTGTEANPSSPRPPEGRWTGCQRSEPLGSRR